MKRNTSKYTEIQETTNLRLLCTDIDNLIYTNKIDEAKSLIEEYSLSYQTYSEYSYSEPSKSLYLFKEAESLKNEYLKKIERLKDGLKIFYFSYPIAIGFSCLSFLISPLFLISVPSVPIIFYLHWSINKEIKETRKLVSSIKKIDTN